MPLRDRLPRLAKTAYELHARGQLGTQYAIHFPGVRFDSSAQDEWIRLHGIGYTPAPANGQTRVEGWTFQADVLARVGKSGGSTHTVWDIAGAVVNAFRYVTVDVLDYDQTGDPKVAELIFGQPEVDRIAQEAGEESRDQLAVTLPATFERFA